MTELDAIVIGSGSGGLTAAIGLSRFGKRIALVERGPIGGDCTNTGCIPSKRLIHLARTAPSDGPAIFADVRATRDGVSGKERKELEDDPNITLIDGTARFTSPREIAVGEQRLSARNIIVATGSRPRDLDIPGLPAERHLTNESLFELTEPPRHLAIVGAGAIGVEMAAAFHRLGTRVTVLDMADRMLTQANPDAAAEVRRAFAARGIEVLLATRTTRYDPATAALHVAGPDGAHAVADVDRVLVAIGRTPNTDELDLPAAGIEAGPDGIAVDTWGRTSVAGIWALGDVTPGSHHTHAANALGRRIIQRIAIPRLPPVGKPPLTPSAVFGDPEVAWIGATQQEIARRFHPDATVHIRVDTAGTDRGLTDGVVHGFAAVHAVRLTGRILSATVVGPGASDTIASFGIAMGRGVSLLRLQRLTWAYPTYAATIGAIADEFASRTLPHLPREIPLYLRNRLRRGAR